MKLPRVAHVFIIFFSRYFATTIRERKIMDIRHLRYFIALIDHGSFSNAAKSLFVTQPTLSQAIKKLEAELNTTLFTQSSQGILLSESGKMIYSRGKHIVDEFDGLVADVKNLQFKQKEHIRIGLTTLFAIQFMREFSSFIATHQDIELTMIQGGSADLQHQLAQGKIDVGLLSYPKYEPALDIRPIEKKIRGYHVSVVIPKNNPLSKRASLTFEDLKDQKFSSLSANFMIGILLKKRSQRFGFTPNIVYCDDNWEVLLSSLKTLDTICLMATEYKNVYTDEELAWIPLKDKQNFFPIGVATYGHRSYSKGVHDLIEMILAS